MTQSLVKDSELGIYNSIKFNTDYCKPNTLKIFYHNCSGIRTKIKDLYLMSMFTSFNVIVLTETWLNDSFYDSELVCENWVLFRMDRDFEGLGLTRGGGVLIAVHKSVPCTKVDLILDRSLEQTWAKIVSENFSVFIGVTYVPPSSPLNLYESHLNQIGAVHLLMEDRDKCLLLGDWNLNLDWEEDEDLPGLLLPRFPSFPSNRFRHALSSPDHDENFISVEFSVLKYLFNKGFVQLNGQHNSLGNILDLVFFSELSDQISIRAASSNESRFKNSVHHSALYLSFELQLPPQVDATGINCFDFKNADYNNIATNLSYIDWSVLDMMDTEGAVDYFYGNLTNLLELYVPRKQKKSQSRYPWLDRELRHLRNMRDRSKNSPNYNELCSLFDERSKLAYTQYIQKIGEGIISDPNSFFDYIKSQKNTDGYPSSIQKDGVFSSDPSAIASMFAHHFSSVYQNPINSTNFSREQSNPTIILDEIILLEEEVLDELLALDPKKSAGPDGIPTFFLINLAEFLVNPLTKLFNKSLSTGYFPDKWKTSFVTPIFKSGSRSDVENYRSISKLSAIPKLFELIVTKRLKPFLEGVLQPQQHGFIKGRSTVTNLACLSNYIHAAFRSNSQVDMIYTNFSKAFDKVDHTRLILKLNFYGIKNKILDWIKSYLCGRSGKF